MGQKYCSNCGQGVLEGFKFCSECGAATIQNSEQGLQKPHVHRKHSEEILSQESLAKDTKKIGKFNKKRIISSFVLISLVVIATAFIFSDNKAGMYNTHWGDSIESVVEQKGNDYELHSISPSEFHDFSLTSLQYTGQKFGGYDVMITYGFYQNSTGNWDGLWTYQTSAQYASLYNNTVFQLSAIEYIVDNNVVLIQPQLMRIDVFFTIDNLYTIFDDYDEKLDMLVREFGTPDSYGEGPGARHIWQTDTELIIFHQSSLSIIPMHNAMPNG
ncbi:zinc-ribbon domain-containing protein [Evansella cellulosilytica]|nr:zinc ribbon domain-containing protein [Evansella cellulosilytica]